MVVLRCHLLPLTWCSCPNTGIMEGNVSCTLKVHCSLEYRLWWLIRYMFLRYGGLSVPSSSGSASKVFGIFFHGGSCI